MIIVTFCRLSFTSCQCLIGTKKGLASGILLNYDDDDYSQGYGQIKEDFRALTTAYILQPYIFDHDFRSSNVRADDVGYKLYVFDIRYQQNFTAARPIKAKFEFGGVVPNNVNGYVLVLTNELDSVSSDGRKHIDLI